MRVFIYLLLIAAAVLVTLLPYESDAETVYEFIVGERTGPNLGTLEPISVTQNDDGTSTFKFKACGSLILVKVKNELIPEQETEKMLYDDILRVCEQNK